MQVFIPYPEPYRCAEVLDHKRLNKQVLECRQLLSGQWNRHPVSLMYRQHPEWLEAYCKCLEEYRNGNIREAREWSGKADSCRPDFITAALCDQHKRRLYTKDKVKYAIFAEYGESMENWYVVDGKMIKYREGKRI